MGVLEASWSLLRALLERLRRLSPILRRLEALLDASWTVLDAFWGPGLSQEDLGPGRRDPMEGGRGEVPSPLDLDFRLLDERKDILDARALLTGGSADC